MSVEKSAAAKPTAGRQPWIYLLFFCSGFPALVYQIVWERALFSIYGINIQSVTIIVSAFMLGLGLGSLAGGAFSRSRRVPLIVLFALAELGTGAFGFFSLYLFHRLADVTVRMSPVSIALITFSMVLVPTTLMGATLPILVEHLVRCTTNVGVSVGGLYFVNTLGSGAACFLSAGRLMRDLGQSGSVRFAAAINTSVAVGALIYSFRTQSKSRDAGVLAESESISNDTTDCLPFAVALVCAAFCGFAALSYEIIWYRLLAFALSDTASAFASLLGAYLFGLALGSRFVERYCRSHNSGTAIGKLSSVFFAGGALAFLVGPLSALAMRLGTPSELQRDWPEDLVMLILVCLAAAFFGAAFPLIAHASIGLKWQVGASLSYLYAANIVGSTVGTLVVGLVLMDHFSLFQISLALLVGNLAFAVVLARRGDARDVRRRVVTRVYSILATCVLVFASRPIFQSIYSRLLFKDTYPGLHFEQVVESRSGVVGVTPDGTVFGGGVYDGRFNVDLLHDTNIIIRPYALSALHPAPRHVLMIGLGSGSWAQVIANHPQVEGLTVVEINPGYLQIIPQHPQVASVLQNRKVHIIIDDGRRWLQRNPAEKFDAIVMNTSFYWRNHSSNLLSVEFLRIARGHLRPGGVFFYNTTNSNDVLATGVSVFPYALRVANALAVSDSELVLNTARWRSVLLNYAIDGKKLIDENDPEQLKKLDELMNIKEGPPGPSWDSFEDNGHLRERLQGRLIITDDNMGLEWRQAK